jgi:hypothetical protein
MTDLITDLRASVDGIPPSALELAAADEIERLRAALDAVETIAVNDTSGCFSCARVVEIAAEAGRGASPSPGIVQRSCFLHGDHTSETCPRCSA